MEAQLQRLQWASATFWLLIILAGNGCKNKQDLAATISDSTYLRRGDSITVITFDTLRKSLLRAIDLYGVEGAIPFCHENASTLTTSYADTFFIRRTSMQYRNPANAPDALEKLVLTKMASVVQRGANPRPEIIRDNSTASVHYFKHIMMQPLCLNCHGKPGSEINEPTLEKVRKLYPQDLAVNFKTGELRGVWHVTFSMKPAQKTD